MPTLWHGEPWLGWAAGQAAAESPPVAEPPALVPPNASDPRPPVSLEGLPPVLSWKSTSPLDSAAAHAAPSRVKTTATDSTLEVIIAATPPKASASHRVSCHRAWWPTRPPCRPARERPLPYETIVPCKPRARLRKRLVEIGRTVGRSSSWLRAITSAPGRGRQVTPVWVKWRDLAPERFLPPLGPIHSRRLRAC